MPPARKKEPDPTNPEMEIAAPNLTPHEGTGRITDWTEQDFVDRFGAPRTIRGSKMPWESFRNLTEDDLRAIYRYLRQVPAVAYETGPNVRAVGWKAPGSAP